MFHQEPESAEKRVLSPKFGGGPKGLGKQSELLDNETNSEILG